MSDLLLLARRYIDEVWNAHDPAALDAFVADTYVEHNSIPGTPPGREGLRAAVEMTVRAFPDVHVTIELELLSGNWVAQHRRGRGTHLGELMGVAPTGRIVEWPGTHLMRFESDRIVEHYGVVDFLTTMNTITAP